MLAEPTQKRSLFRKLSWLVAPVFTALFPVVSVYSASLDEANISDVVLSGIAVSIGAIVIAVVLCWFCHSTTRAGLAAVFIIVCFFSFAIYMRFGRFLCELIGSSPWNDYLLLLVWLPSVLATLYCIFRLRWNEQWLHQVYQFLQLACVFSFAVLLIQCVHGYLQVNRLGADDDTIWASETEAVPASWKPHLPSNPRDMYFIILDRYANADTLKQFFGYDNSGFYAELEKRGFAVDRHANASYPMTAPSMASTLNMRYLDSTFANVADYFRPVEMNEAAKLFIAAGYKYHYFGNLYSPLRTSRLADWNLRLSLMPTEFADSLVGLTPLRPLVGRHYKHRLVLDKFRQLAETAKNPDMTFVYAHFLMPHPPYVFAADGSALSEWSRTTRSEQELYVEQLIATNNLLLKTIDAILANSVTKPVIILQADEGPYLMAGDDKLSREQQIAKRVGILNAVLFPDDEVLAHLPHPLMPVNTFRFVFNEYFAAPLELLPNHVFYWEHAEPNGTASTGTKIVEVAE